MSSLQCGSMVVQQCSTKRQPIAELWLVCRCDQSVKWTATYVCSRAWPTLQLCVDTADVLAVW